MSEYKDKYQLFEYFKSVKNPNLCRESVFQKRFEDIYADFKNSIFYSLNFSFKERLYLYFIDDYELTSEHSEKDEVAEIMFIPLSMIFTTDIEFAFNNDNILLDVYNKHIVNKAK